MALMTSTKITTVNLFLRSRVGTQGTGGTTISDPIDLRDISGVGDFTLAYTTATTSGIAGTVGSSLISYMVAMDNVGTSFWDAGTFGTLGAAPATGYLNFTPPVYPFIKIKHVTGTSNALLVTADLNVR